MGAVLALSMPSAALATPVYWTGAVNNLWSIGGNWTGGVVPGSSDDVYINLYGSSVVLDTMAVVNSVTVGSGESPAALTVPGYLLQADTMTVRDGATVTLDGGAIDGYVMIPGGTFDWRAGTVGGSPGGLYPGAAGLVRLDSPGGKTLGPGCSIYVDSTSVLQFHDGSLDLSGQNTITVDGLFEILGDTLLSAPPAPDSSVLIVNGILERLSSGGLAEIDVPVFFQTQSWLGLEIGWLRFSRSLSASGTVNVGPLATLALGAVWSGGRAPGPLTNGGTPDWGFYPSSQVIGSGSVQVDAGWAQLASQSWGLPRLIVHDGRAEIVNSMSVDTFVLTGGQRDGLGTLSVGSWLDWQGGGFDGAGLTIVTSTAEADLITAGGRFITGQHRLVVDGIGDWSQGSLDLGGPANPGTLEIGVSGTFGAQADAALTGSGMIRNFGLFGRGPESASSGTTVIEPYFENRASGLAGSTLGTLILAGGTLNQGTLATYWPATLEIRGMLDSSQGTIQSDGALRFDNCVATVRGAQVKAWTFTGSSMTMTALVVVTSLDFVSGLITGPATLTVTNDFAWREGEIRGPGLVGFPPGSTLTLTGSGAKRLTQSEILRMQGTCAILPPAALTLEGAGVVNDPSGSWNLDGDVSLLAHGGLASYFYNTGAFHKTTGAGTAVVEPAFSNGGEVACFAGTLQFASFEQDEGTTALHDASIAVPGGTLVLGGGSLIGRGTINGSVFNAGTVSPGFSEGKLTITNNYTQAATGTLDMEVASAGIGGKFDQLAVGGTASLDGTINVTGTEGYVAEPGDKLDLVSAGSVSGEFSDVNMPVGSNGAELQGKLVGTSFVVVAPVALQLGNAQTSGTAATVSVGLGAGAACVQSLSGSLAYSTELTLASSTSAGGCTLAATETAPGAASFTLTCPGGKTGTLTVGTLTFNLAASAPQSTVGCGTANAVDCAGSGTSLAGGCATGAIFQGCLGDLAPDGTGGGGVTLADFVLARRKVSGLVAINARDTTCGDLHPGAFTCTPAVGARSWCPAGNELFQLADAIVIRQLIAGISTLSCQACALSDGVEPTPPRPGDVALDGRVDVADVVAALRVAVGLDALDDARLPLADVAPAEPESAGVLAPRGDGRVDVADVVLLLRSAVGLSRLEWPLRELALVAESDAPFGAFVVRVEGWPAWAELASTTAPACDDPEADGLDRWGGRLAVTCLAGAPLAGRADLAVLRYRAPRALDPAALRVTGEAVRDDLATVPAEYRAEAR